MALPLVLFDLDDTLSDRAGAFRSWAQRWLVRHNITDPDALEWMTTNDDGGYQPRDLLFSQAVDRFGLDASPSDLAADYQRTAHDDYREDPALIAMLTELAASGWRIGVVTNGADGQTTKINKLGIAGLLDCCVVSGTVGIRKPDPGIFDIAVRDAGGPGHERPWMVGDHPRNDIDGAHRAGLHAMWISHGRAWTGEGVPPDRTCTDLPSAVALLVSHELPRTDPYR